MIIASKATIGSATSDYLANYRPENREFRLEPGRAFFLQGAPADSVFFIRSGNAKLTVVSKEGKEAIIMLLGAGDFVGEESIARVGMHRISTARTTNVCTIVRIGREEMLRALREEPKFSKLFLAYMLHRGQRMQADFVDQLFNYSEKRLARILLLLAGFDEAGKAQMLTPLITQETLAEMIGTTRARVSFFMNRFRNLGYIEYNGRLAGIRVQESLLKALRSDTLPGEGHSEHSRL